jgi:hypothetical protein
MSESVQLPKRPPQPKKKDLPSFWFHAPLFWLPALPLEPFQPPFCGWAERNQTISAHTKVIYDYSQNRSSSGAATMGSAPRDSNIFLERDEAPEHPWLCCEVWAGGKLKATQNTNLTKHQPVSMRHNVVIP